MLFIFLITSSFSAVVLGAGIDDLSEIEVSSVECADEDLSRCYIGSYGDVMKIAESEKIYIRLVTVTAESSISEEEKHIYLVECNAGCDLVASA